MPSASAHPDPLHFFGLTAEQFDATVVDWGWPRFRAQQVRDWVYGKLVTDPERMTNLSKRDQQTLRERVTFNVSEITADQRSSDGTIKLLLTWNRNEEPDAASNDQPAPGTVRLSVQSRPSTSATSAETVMIPDADRRTACVSSQIGCPVGCTFCASGMNGVKGNLSAAQIVEQVFQLNRVMGEGESDEARKRRSDVGKDEETGDASETRVGKGTTRGFLPPSSLRRPPTASRLPVAPSLPPRITNIVFMGMGEPLANYANVLQAIRVLHDPQCLNLGARRITVSTVGVPPKMRDLAHEELPLNLALSLHAPSEPLRKQLIPWAEHFALDDILDAARYYFDRTGREITLEYILLHDVNDQPDHARQLARLCKTVRANVNLIRYNEVAGLPYLRPKAEDVVRFQDILRRAGVNAHVRKSRGRDIDAACGQLRRKTEQPASPNSINR